MSLNAFSVASIVDFEAIAKSVFWPAATAVAGYLFGRARDVLRMRTFRRVFGKGVTKSEDIVVSVPFWRAIGSERSTPRFLTTDATDTTGSSQTHHGPDNMYNREDMFAAASVLNVIGNHLGSEVKFGDDTETPVWDNKTAILIGAPTVNFHGKSYFARHANERPDELLPIFRKIEATGPGAPSSCIFDPKTEREFKSDDKSDYGLVLRVGNALSKDSSHFVFLIAGINASGTREAGRLFREEWNRLGKRRAVRERLAAWVSSRILGKPPRPQGFVFKMTRNVVGTGKIECHI